MNSIAVSLVDSLGDVLEPYLIKMRLASTGITQGQRLSDHHSLPVAGARNEYIKPLLATLRVSVTQQLASCYTYIATGGYKNFSYLSLRLVSAPSNVPPLLSSLPNESPLACEAQQVPVSFNLQHSTRKSNGLAREMTTVPKFAFFHPRIFVFAEWPNDNRLLGIEP